MPPRIARSSIQSAAPKTARNKNRKRNLDAYSIASHSLPAKSGVRQNRLGELLDDAARQKRRRVGDDDDGNEDSAEEVPRKRAKQSAVNGPGIEEGSDSEGNEWTLGGLREDDNDSDLDSDDAFGESDEERFAEFTFRGSSSRGNDKKRMPLVQEAAGRDLDLDEEDGMEINGDADEDEDDDFGDEGVDLATMLDEDGESGTAANRDNDDADTSDDGSNMSEDAQSDFSDDEDEVDGEAADEERIARMRDRLEALEPQQDTAAPPRSSKKSGGLTLDDLLGAAGDLISKKDRKKASQAKPLPAPLPQRQQDRLNREVASKKAKEQLDRWRDTVTQNRRAEFLSFPLKDPEKAEPLGKDKFAESTGASRTELEDNIRKIMEEAGMVSQNAEEGTLMKAEELAENKIPLEEVERRRAELRRARELMFREEIKAKRIAKIKSKAYRRVHRREKARERELLGEDADGVEGEKEQADRKRAEARMSTKHKDSKWAKSLKATNRGVWDEEAREGVNEQARRNEELRRRVAGEEIDGEESDGESDDGSVESGAEDDHTLKQLDRVSKGDRDGQDEGGIAGMKFMRKAEEGRRKQNDEDVDRMRKELAVADGDESESDDGVVEDQGLGRAIFGPTSKVKKGDLEAVKKPPKAEFEEGSASEAEEEQEQIPGDHSRSLADGQSNHQRRNHIATKQSSNQLSSQSKTNGRRDFAQPTGKIASDWLTGPINRSKKTSRSAKEEDGAAVIDLGRQASSAPGMRSGPSTAKSTALSSRTNGMQADAFSLPENAANTEGWTLVTYKDNQMGSESDEDEAEAEPSNPMLDSRSQNVKYQNRAFASADVKASFDTEKADAIASEDEKEISNHLPGWGSWTGEGLSKAIRKANTKQRHNPLFKTKIPGVKAEDRKDAKLENVIVSERQDRKGKKYRADILPHGFEKKEQYERALRVPMGPEWVTKETFQRNTRPRVVVRPGTVVAAIERPLV